jgi:hypothetical protein
VIEKDTRSGSQPCLAVDAKTLTSLAEHRLRVAERCAALGCELPTTPWSRWTVTLTSDRSDSAAVAAAIGVQVAAAVDRAALWLIARIA